MTPALNHPQRKAQHGNAGTFHCGMGRAAPIADGYKLHGSSRPSARNEKLRANSGALTRSGFFFRGWSGTCDEVADAFRLRAAGLRDEQIAACLSPSMDAGGSVSIRIEPGLDQPMSKPAHVVVPSSSARLDRDRDREAEGSVPKSSGEFPTVRGTFQHECC